eukprot:scaffold77291_cov22-Tisochrysis_lutea.AAC.1
MALHSERNCWSEVFTKGLLEVSTLLEESFGPAVLALQAMASAIGAAVLQTMLLPASHTICGPGDAQLVASSRSAQYGIVCTNKGRFEVEVGCAAGPAAAAAAVSQMLAVYLPSTLPACHHLHIVDTNRDFSSVGCNAHRLLIWA